MKNSPLHLLRTPPCIFYFWKPTDSKNLVNFELAILQTLLALFVTHKLRVRPRQIEGGKTAAKFPKLGMPDAAMKKGIAFPLPDPEKSTNAFP